MGKNLRETKQRLALRRVLEEAKRPLQPREIRDIASKEIPSLGIATVYRNLKSMVEDKLVEQIELPGQMTCYSLPRKEKKPILFCNRSKRVEFTDLPPVEESAAPNLPSGFVLHGREVIYIGEFQDVEEDVKEYADEWTGSASCRRIIRLGLLLLAKNNGGQAAFPG